MDQEDCTGINMGLVFTSRLFIGTRKNPFPRDGE